MRCSCWWRMRALELCGKIIINYSEKQCQRETFMQTSFLKWAPQKNRAWNVSCLYAVCRLCLLNSTQAESWLFLSFFYCFLWSEVFPHPATIKSFLMFAIVLNVATCHFLSAPLIITAHPTRKTRTGETNEFPPHPLRKPRTRVRRRTFPRQFVLPCNSNYSNLTCVSFSCSVQRNLWGLI